MAPRKPPQVKFEDFVEQQIREAQEQGEFDRLPGSGKPLPFVDRPHDPMRWLKEKLEREKLSLLPESLEIRREVEKVLQDLPKLTSEQVVRERLEALDARIRKVNRTAAAGPPTTVAPLDVEALVRRWREDRRRR